MLTPDERRKVAEYCLPQFKWIIYGGTDVACHDYMWNPSLSGYLWQALVQKCAELIEGRDLSLLAKRVKGMDDSAFDKEYANVVRLYASLGAHLANNNVTAIEQLVYEMLGEENG